MQKEIWLPIIGFENKYLISSLGRVKSLARTIRNSNGTINRHKKEHILSPRVDNHGYPTTVINNKTYLTHRLVAKAFIPNPENKKFVNHKNKIRHDNRIDNLEWCTSKENNIHAVTTGKKRISDKLTPIDVKKIKVLLRKKIKGSVIAKKYKVSRTTISLIKNNKRWSYIK